MGLKLDGKLIPQLLEATATRFPERNALMFNRGDGTMFSMTYSHFWERAKKLSSFIQKKGFTEGSHIALVGTNSPDWATAYFAVLISGCVVVPLDPTLRPQELRHIIRHSDSAAIFLSEKLATVISEDDEKTIQKIPYFELESIEDSIRSERDVLPPRYPSSDETPAVVIYTSGTTGSPKGAVLSHRNIVGDVEGIIERYSFVVDDTFLSVLPVHHAFEATCGFLTPIALGCGICYARTLRAKEILEDIRLANATILLGVPLLFDKIYNGILKGIKKKGGLTESLFNAGLAVSKFIDSSFHAHSGKYLMKVFRSKAGFGNLYLMMSGGAAINPETVNFFNGFGIICAQGYGLTETSPVICVNPPKKNKPSTVGPAIKGVEIRIAEPDNDQIGEIQAKGIPVFSGYYKNPEATREAFTDDGWFKTGDLGMMDSDGYVTITGRAKNVIVTGAGKNIYPEELEEKLNMSQFVVESLIVPTHSESGEEPFAIIVPDFDAVDAHFSGIWDDPALETLLKNEVEIINSKIAPYKRIKGFKIQQEEFPKTSTRKIKRYLFTGRGIIVKN